MISGLGNCGAECCYRIQMDKAGKKWNVFISHASETKDTFVRSCCRYRARS
jgi:hypothetical protein